MRRLLFVLSLFGLTFFFAGNVFAIASDSGPTPISTPGNLTPAQPCDNPTVLSTKIWCLLNKSAKNTYNAQGAGAASTALQSTLLNVIQIFFGILGTAAVILMIYAGFLWMTAGGNEEPIAKAKKIIMQTVVGFIVIIFAYGIVSFAYYTVLALKPAK